jgi:hypothetical protein
LARTDAALLLTCLGFCCLLDAFPLERKSLSRLAELFFLPAAVFILYALFNYNTLGSPWQVSGELKRFPLTSDRISIAALGLIISLLVGWILKNWGKLPLSPAAQHNLAPTGDRSRFPCLKDFINNTWWFALFCCFIIIYYTALQAFPQLWYFGPVLLYGFIIFMLAVIDILSSALREDLSSQSANHSLARLKVILMVPLTLCGIVVNYSAADPRFLSMCITNQKAGEWISKNLPQDAILGSWDAGVIAYFATQKIINLDGVVNSIDYARALSEGTAGELLKKQGITYLVNHGLVDNGEDKELKQLADKLFGKNTSNSLRLEKIWPFTFRGSTNRLGRGIWPMAVFLYRM